MSKYRVHSIKVRKEDGEHAKAILDRYRNKNYFDDMRVENRSDGVLYWINPFLSEDLDIIMDTFKQAGIQVL
jgi:hypothetical protein